MRITLFSIGVALLLTPAYAGEDTNVFAVFTHSGRHGDYEFRITEAALMKTPEWNIDTDPCPLAPGRAWQIAKRWLDEHQRSGSTLVRILIQPVGRDGIESKAWIKRYGRRFFYKIDVVPAAFDTMCVYVLMDGTVVEPKSVPLRIPEEPK